MRLSSCWRRFRRDRPDETLARQVNFEQLPSHIAIIMDGNGGGRRSGISRASKATGPNRFGARRGRTSARLASTSSPSTRFPSRTEAAPRGSQHADDAAQAVHPHRAQHTAQEHIRFRVIGRADELAPDVQDELQIGIRQTAGHSGMLFNIALNYGGRAEIVDAARRAIAEGIAADDLDERRFGELLYTAGQPDPTSHPHQRRDARQQLPAVADAYSEIWVTETCGPTSAAAICSRPSSPTRARIAATAASSRRRWRSARNEAVVSLQSSVSSR